MNKAQDRSAPAIIIEPDPSRIVQRAAEHFCALHSSSRALCRRDELGLPTDRPVIMTGHQPSWWHAGILSKFLACDAIAQSLNAACAWVVADQDEESFSEIALPVRTPTGGLGRETLNLTRAQGAGLPPASLRPFDPLPLTPTAEPATKSVANGLGRLRRALLAHRGQPTAARQVMGALRDLVTPTVAPAPTIFASELNKCELFQELLDKLRADPAGARDAYNAAAERHPEARVAQLKHSPEHDRLELPLWRLQPGKPRQTVYSSDLDAIATEELAPKALLLTGLLRLGACDLFIHGTGGGVYDRVTEAWLADWLGVELAPMLVVSATLTLPLTDEAPTPQDVQRAVWRGHHARHHPRLIGSLSLQTERDRIVQRISSEKRNGGDPSALYQSLHKLLTAHREANRDALDQLATNAAAMRAKLADGSVASDRAWPFFLHDEESLDGLASAIRSALRPGEAALGPATMQCRA